MAKYEKGQSGNKSGRPAGSKGKMSANMLADYLSRQTKDAIDAVIDVMKNDKNPNSKLRAALALLTEDDKARERIYKEVQENLKIERERVQLELDKIKLKEASGEQGNKPSSKEDNSTPILSLKAVK